MQTHPFTRPQAITGALGVEELLAATPSLWQVAARAPIQTVHGRAQRRPHRHSAIAENQGATPIALRGARQTREATRLASVLITAGAAAAVLPAVPTSNLAAASSCKRIAGLVSPGARTCASLQWWRHVGDTRKVVNANVGFCRVPSVAEGGNRADIRHVPGIVIVFICARTLGAQGLPERSRRD